MRYLRKWNEYPKHASHLSLYPIFEAKNPWTPICTLVCYFVCTIKGTHEMDFAFDDMYG